MKNFWKRWAVLLISIIFLSSCGASNSSPSATPLTPEGIISGVITPVTLAANITTNLHQGTVGNTSTGSKSYYQLTLLAAGTYTVTIYGLSADADLWVYNNLPFDYITGPVCKSQNGGTANEQCVVTVAANATMNIEVDGQYSLSGATYYISVNYPGSALPSCSGVAGTCFDFDTNPASSAFPTTFVFTESGSGTLVPWNLDGTSALGAVYSIHSGGVDSSQTSCFAYTATTSTDSYVSFDLTGSLLTQYYDLLLFYIDNVLQLPAWSGSFSQHVMFNTTTGIHTYKWCHTNNSTGMSGDVWVDNIYIQ